MKYKSLFYLSLIFILTSCEKEIVIDTQHNQALMVVNATFNNLTSVKVHLTESSYVGQEVEDVYFISDAEVMLFEDDEYVGSLNYEMSDSLNYNNYGFYSMDFIPKMGKSYKLEIHHPNYPTVYAIDTMPNLNVGYIQLLAYPDSLHPARKAKLEVNLSDNKERNHYRMVGYSWQQFALVADTTIAQEYFSSEFLKPKGIAVSGDLMFFSDDDFNNTNLNLTFTPSSIKKLSWTADTSITFVYDKLYRLFQIQSLSNSYVVYYNTLLASSGLGTASAFNEPIPIHNNIKGGLGHFDCISLQQEWFEIN